MKFKAIFYPLICIALVAALASFLVFIRPKSDDKSGTSAGSNQSQQLNTGSSNKPNSNNSSGASSGGNTNNTDTKTDNTKTDNSSTTDDTNKTNESGGNNGGNSSLNPTDDKNSDPSSSEGNGDSKQSSSSASEDNTTADDETKTDKDETPSTPNKNHITKLELLCENQIFLCLNEVATLSNYLAVEPSNLISDVKIELLENDVKTSNISFENNELRATKVGEYEVKFSAPTEASELCASLKVLVTDSCPHFKFLKNKFELSKTYSISNIVTNLTKLNMTVSACDNKISVNNGSIVANDLGSTNLKFELESEHISYSYVLACTVISAQNYKIILPDLATNTIETTNEKVGINYQVTLGNLGYVNQDVLVEVLDKSVASLLSNEAPIVKIKKQNSGTVRVKLSLASNPEVYTIVTIIFK